MSIKATNWVWGLALPPTPKLILMALADEADDEGICWPSIKRIARKACVSERTVRRALAEYGDSALLQVSTRVRPDGGQSSNSYKLALGSVTPTEQSHRTLTDKLSPPVASGRGRLPQMSAQPLPQRCQGAVVRATAGHYPLQDPSEKPTTTTRDFVLEAPRSLGADDTHVAVRLVADRISDQELAQQVLDELDAKFQARAIKGTWESYLWGLIRKVEQGAFVAAAGRGLAKMREEEARKARFVKKKPTPASPEAVKAHIARCQKELRSGPRREDVDQNK